MASLGVLCRHALPPEPWGDRQQVGGSGVQCPQRPQRRSRPTSWDINARSSSLPSLARRHGTDRCGNAAPLVGGNRRRSRSYRHQPTNSRSPEIGNRHHTDCIRGCGLIGLVQGCVSYARHMSVMKCHHYWRPIPIQADRPDHVVSDSEPAFAAMPVLRGARVQGPTARSQHPPRQATLREPLGASGIRPTYPGLS